MQSIFCSRPGASFVSSSAFKTKSVVMWQDGDVLWVRNPFDRFAQDADVQLSSDHFSGDPLSMKNSPNSGFVYTRSNNRTVAMYKYWYDARNRNPGKNDQMVLNTILKEQAFLDLGVKIQYLGTVYFGGFCQVCCFHHDPACCSSLFCYNLSHQYRHTVYVPVLPMG